MGRSDKRGESKRRRGVLRSSQPVSSRGPEYRERWVGFENSPVFTPSCTAKGTPCNLTSFPHPMLAAVGAIWHDWDNRGNSCMLALLVLNAVLAVATPAASASAAGSAGPVAAAAAGAAGMPATPQFRRYGVGDGLPSGSI